MTAGAVGGLVGTALYDRLTGRFGLSGVMRGGLVIETLTHPALALARSPWVAGVVMVVFGAHVFVWGTTATAVRQRAVPLPLQGRVKAVYGMAMYGGLVVGAALGGVIAARFGVAGPFWFAFVGSAVCLTLLWGRLARIVHGEPAVSG